MLQDTPENCVPEGFIKGSKGAKCEVITIIATVCGMYFPLLWSNWGAWGWDGMSLTCTNSSFKMGEY